MPPSRKLRRIVCYAVSGSGLGHVTRLMAIARWLRRYVTLLEGRPPEVHFLTSTEAPQLLWDAGFTAFKLPSQNATRDAGHDMLEFRRLARHFVWNTLGVFRPDLLVVDTFPAGSFDELLQVLDGPFRKGFVHRHVKPAYAARPTFQAALRLYDTVIVPHAAPDDGAPVHAPPPPGAVHTGEILHVEREDLADRAAARARLGVPGDARLIYVSAGGGGDPGSEATLRALLRALASRPALHVLVGAGPLYRAPRPPEAAGPRVTWYTGHHVARLLPACDAALSAGGYNTFHELLFARVPTLFYAQDKVADDQRARIDAAVQRGACAWLPPAALAPDAPDASAREALLGALDDLLRPDRAAAMRAAAAPLIPADGARRAALALLAASYPQEQLAWASQALTPGLAHAFEAHGPPGREALGQWLPALLPAGRLRALAAAPALRALLERLPPPAAEAVRQALRDEPGAALQAALQAALRELVTASAAWPGGLGTLRGLVDAAMKKWPLAQEAPTSPQDPPGCDARWARWLLDVLRGVAALAELAAPDGAAAPLGLDDVFLLFRPFPRLVDADLATAREVFQAAIEATRARGEDALALSRRVRALKFAHKRVTVALARAALCPPRPTSEGTP